MPQEPDGPQFKGVWMLTILMAVGAVCTFRSVESFILGSNFKDAEVYADNWLAEMCTFLTFVFAFFVWWCLRLHFSSGPHRLKWPVKSYPEWWGLRVVSHSLWRSNRSGYQRPGRFIPFGPRRSCQQIWWGIMSHCRRSQPSTALAGGAGQQNRGRALDAPRKHQGSIHRHVLPEKSRSALEPTGPSEKIDDYLRAVLAWCHAEDLVRAEKLLLGSRSPVQVRQMHPEDAYALVSACIVGGDVCRSANWLMWLYEQGVQITPATVSLVHRNLILSAKEQPAENLMLWLSKNGYVEEESSEAQHQY